MYTYRQTETAQESPPHGLFTVGHETPDGFEPESDHGTAQEAAERVRFLNGGHVASALEPLNLLAAEVVAINRANGWKVLEPSDWENTEYKIPAVLALVTSEVSEALEGYRLGDRVNFDEEIADVVIRCLDIAGGLGINLDAEVRRKLTINRERGFRHGNKRV